ncbi:MAG: hypothetical protein K2Y29_00450 [Beijerinckiaceae bacterium]|nr:hypothetical protein [Beijerinckiaceae bacterium]
MIAVNDAMLHAPWADVVFSIDTVWLRRRQAALMQFAGEKVMAVPAAPRSMFIPPLPGVRYLRRVSAVGLSVDPGAIASGFNSGYGALGMAIMRGASEVFLLGYDMNGPGHFHRGYDWFCRFGVRQYPTWAAMFSRLAERSGETRVINCNPASAIRCFPFASIDEVLHADQGIRRLLG